MSRFYKILIPIMLTLIAIAAGVQYNLYLKHQETNTRQGRPAAPEFTLNTATEQAQLSLSQFRGNAVVIYFGYASCPDVCPVDLGIVGSMLRKLSPEQQEKVTALFITLDPERDTPERLLGFSRFFHPKIIGLYGSPEEISEVARSYGVIYEKSFVDNDPNVYWVSHSANFFLINPEGQLVAALPRETTPEQLGERLQALIN